MINYWTGDDEDVAEDHLDAFTDPMDDGTRPLPPFTFDPLCEVRGETFPANEIEAERNCND